MSGTYGRHMLTVLPVLPSMWGMRRHRKIRTSKSTELCARYLEWTYLINRSLDDLVREHGAERVAEELREANTVTQVAQRFGIDVPAELQDYFDVVDDDLMTEVLDEMALGLEKGLMPLLDWQPDKVWSAAFPQPLNGILPVVIRGPWPTEREVLQAV